MYSTTKLPLPAHRRARVRRYGSIVRRVPVGVHWNSSAVVRPRPSKNILEQLVVLFEKKLQRKKINWLFG